MLDSIKYLNFIKIKLKEVNSLPESCCVKVAKMMKQVAVDHAILPNIGNDIATNKESSLPNLAKHNRKQITAIEIIHPRFSLN